LGRYLQADPRALRFAAGSSGEPMLLGRVPRSPAVRLRSRGAKVPSFNLSHSGPLALYAFAETADVGVDIEIARRPRDRVRIAARAFGPSHARRLERLAPVGGQSEPLAADLRIAPRAAAALAVRHVPREFRCWEFDAACYDPR
jgi:phosphopantetheinyl transferase